MTPERNGPPRLSLVMLSAAAGADDLVLGVRVRLLGLAQEEVLHELGRVDAGEEGVVDKVFHA